LASISAGYALHPGGYAGIELGGGLLHYAGSDIFFTDARQWNAGVFLHTQLSQHVQFRGSVGYTDYAPENTQSTNSLEHLTGVYAQIALQHRVNRFLAYTLSGGRSISFGFYGGSVDLSYAHLQANWRIMKKVGLETWVQYEHGTQVSSFGEKFDRYGGGINVTRAITAKSYGSLGYQF